MFDEFKSGLLRVFVDCGDVYLVGNASLESISAEGLSNLITPKYDKIDLEEFLKEWEKLL